LIDNIEVAVYVTDVGNQIVQMVWRARYVGWPVWLWSNRAVTRY